MEKLIYIPLDQLIIQAIVVGYEFKTFHLLCMILLSMYYMH